MTALLSLQVGLGVVVVVLVVLVVDVVGSVQPGPYQSGISSWPSSWPHRFKSWSVYMNWQPVGWLGEYGEMVAACLAREPGTSKNRTHTDNILLVTRGVVHSGCEFVWR